MTAEPPVPHERAGSSDPFSRLPVDPDSDPARPAHLRWGPVGVVAAGGALGAPARYLFALWWPTPPDGWPWATMVTNVLGAFALGLLLESLVSLGRETPRTRVLRLFAGTGFLGAFTTYSTLAVEADLLIRDGHSPAAIAYVVASAVLGVLAALIGIGVASGLPTRWSGESREDPDEISVSPSSR